MPLNNELLISGSRVRAPHGPLGAKPTEQVNVGAKAFRKHLRCSFFIFQNN